jgi:membrane-associated phospholipid phosphatase
MNTSQTLTRCIALLLLAVILLPSCNPDKNNTNPNGNTTTPVFKKVSEFDHTITTGWNEKFLEVERYAAGYRPGPAPRALAYLGLSAYEACVAGMTDHKSVATKFPDLKIPQVDITSEYNWDVVANASYSYLMPRFFETSATKYVQLIAEYQKTNETKLAASVAPDVYARSQKHGIAVATAVWAWATTDSYGHNGHLSPFGSGYDWKAKFKKPGDWEPTVPGPGKPMFPQWGEARRFAMTAEERLCKPPIPYNTDPKSAYYAQGLEVYKASAVKTQTAEGKWIGEFWSDDLLNLTFSPGPRWVAIANQIYIKEKSNLETALLVNAKIGMAMNDAAVSCWYSKYYYNLERPENYIKNFIDPTWEPALDNPLTGDKGFTPPFPAYPSGHSTMGAAAASVLSDQFGYAYTFTDYCHDTRTEFVGKARTFKSFYEAASENAYSRVPLGVHWRMDCEEGVVLGITCGHKVNAFSWIK